MTHSFAQQLGAGAGHGAENAGIEGEDALKTGTVAQIVQPCHGRFRLLQKPGGWRAVLEPFGNAGRALVTGQTPKAQREMFALAARERQRHQFVVGESEERALQHGAKREIVLEIGDHPAERDEILNRDVIGDDQPVRAGDADMFFAKGRRHGRDEAGPVAHQNQKIAGM